MQQKIMRLIRSKEAVLLLITIVIFVAFTINNDNFRRMGNLQGIMQTMSVTGVMTVGMALLFIGGGIDLSMTFVALFSGVICATMIAMGIPWPLAILITLVLGACLGAINAFFITKVNVMAFIMTIALSQMLQGVNLIITNAQDIAVTVEGFRWGARMLWIFPIPFVIMTLLIVGFGLILTKTRFGRSIYMVGGNEYAARLAGINPKKVRAILYIIAGTLSSLAGVMFTSRMASAAPAAAADWQMNAVTAAILGGVAFGGGSGSMIGCLIGIAMLNIFNFGLTSIGLATQWITMASGALLLIALTMDFLNERSRKKSLGLITTKKKLKLQKGV